MSSTSSVVMVLRPACREKDSRSVATVSVGWEGGVVSGCCFKEEEERIRQDGGGESIEALSGTGQEWWIWRCVRAEASNWPVCVCTEGYGGYIGEGRKYPAVPKPSPSWHR